MEPSSTDNARMFGDNTAISGGQFTIAENVFHVNGTKASPFAHLQQRVASAAFHSSAQRVDPPRCHPDTRVAVLQKIYDWIIQSEFREEWLLWLNGAAGAGKSAIMQSIAERCAQATMSIASFFFFRSDPTRNTIAPLIPTLAYQLIQTIPMTSDYILTSIEHNPLIFEQSLQVQLQKLIIDPLLRIPPDWRQLFVVFIDGLDECDNRAHQAELIKVLGDVSRGEDSPVLFLVSGRREPQIEAAFAQMPVAGLLRTVPLDAIPASDDIRRYIDKKFSDIRETHIRRHLLPPNWPQISDVEEIVTNSSGQFIFASVVMSYVSSPRANPAAQFEIIRGIRLRHPSSENPFAHLDALYQHIFSQVENLDMVLDIIAYVWLREQYRISDIEDHFG
ncbi:hypothetical protein BJ912DRAFT_117117 [Pholiota molesta]|nr:hypothetical protein BJ912DRAFT_117117 [Pholiota molesta]